MILEERKRIILNFLAIIFIIGGFCFLVSSVNAQTVDLGVDQVGKSTGLPSDDVRVVIARIIRVALGFLGTLALVIILYAGYLWMSSGGNEEKIAQAKKILINATIGLVIILSSYAFTSFIIRRLLGATQGGNLPDHCYNGKKDNGETGVDCGGACGVCSTDQPTFPGGNIFYVSSLPSGGDVCIRNVHLAVVFNKDVDISTMNGNVVVVKKGGEEVKGKWEHGTEQSMAVFVPEGVCGGIGGNDCLEANTAYTLEFKNANAIKSANGLLTLNCTVKAGCGPVDFVSGVDVDRNPPTIKIISPPDKSSVAAGSAVPVKLEFTDDSGLQSVSLYQGPNLINSQSLSGCKKSGEVDLAWSTTGLSAGSYALSAFALDWSAQKGEAQTSVNILPFHCYNDSLEQDLGEVEKGPPACGGECGRCGGDSCGDNGDCASGFCDRSGGGPRGVCIDKMKINAISPLSGSPGTYVSIGGSYFGDEPGEVYFSRVKNPSPDRKTDWVRAPLVSCGGSDSWISSQVLVEVPVGVVDGPIMVATANIIGRDKVARQFVDLTNDTWGPKINDFKITSEVRPGLCTVNPSKGVAGDKVQLIGKNFGLLDNDKDYVSFGEEFKAPIVGTNWSDTSIQATVPFIDQGIVGVKVFSNGVESNGVRFVVDQGESIDSPIISNVTPSKGAKGEYITITGKNFGSTIGAVWFKESLTSEAIIGDFSFPENCQKGVWSENQIIVKFPKDKGDVGKKYFIQVKTSANKITRFDNNLEFTLEAGEPAPGICKISPVSGPVPLPEGQAISVFGEYFSGQSDVYFWKTGANPVSIDGRVVVPKTDIISSNDKTIVVRPPASISTGPVVVYKSAEKKISNPAQFTILDCVKNGNKCSLANETCCINGQDKGVCKSAGESCEGASLSTGYVWRFSTGDIPLIPQVVERCDSDTDAGKNLPTPSPSIQWDQTNNEDHHNVCRSALVVVEFNVPLNQTSINGSTVSINKCSSIENNNCLNPTPLKISSDSYNLKVAQAEEGGASRAYLSLFPEVGKWEDNSWYQVVLTKGIKSAGKISLPLAADKPCSQTDSAYCFVFRTDAKDCRMKAVVVTPYSYWTSILEEPIRYRVSGIPERDLTYHGNGLSDQHCIIMDTSAFNWSWKTGNKNYSVIFGESTHQSAKASALANTVGVGLNNPDDAVEISATAQLDGRSFTGTSPLTIDLNNPEIVDYWPKCLETCTNAEVAVRFNTSMSLRNLPGAVNGGTVQLLKCNDENCLSTVSIISLSDIVLDSNSNYTILKLANSTEGSTPLDPDTIYKVILSASSSNPNTATNQLWSAAKFKNPNTWSKPYNKEFTWRFRTKKDKCSIDRVEVMPFDYYASSIKEKVTYNVDAFSSPDACSKEGQKLDPWSVNWEWTSSDPKVATVTTFNTKGKNRFCTNSCVRKGSDIPGGNNPTAVCGNGIVEAGEDCDSPDKSKGCSLNCLFTGNTSLSCGNGTVESVLGEACDTKDPKTSIGCSKDCRHVGSSQTTDSGNINASICGNGSLGSGEDCDLGIVASVTKPSSALNCSEKCLHVGTRLSTKWCFDNRLTRGGFTAVEYENACGLSYSQCGDKVENPDEDPDCDQATTGWDSAKCTEFCLRKTDSECAPNSEGCDSSGHHIGSSLLYSKPSVCGDGQVGIGEDAFCEAGLTIKHEGLIDPWSLVTGVGLGNPVGDPPAQSTRIKALTTQQTKGGAVSNEGKFTISCGYKNDQECQEVFGNSYGVGASGCCYAQAKLVSTYPVNDSTNACPNTYLEAVFDTAIDPNTLKDNILIARGANDCKDQEEVTSLIAQADSVQNNNVPWYKRIIVSLKNFVKRVSGNQASAAPPKWCIGSDVGAAEVVPVSEANTTTAKIIVKLSKPLEFNTDYAIIIKEVVKTIQGVSVGRKNGKNISWKFSTISTICELNAVEVEPAQWSFSRAGATTTLQAKGKTNNGTFIQGIPNFYDWEYVWGPDKNDLVSLNSTTSSINTITAQNRNGEIDIRASANITANKYSNTSGLAATGKSHIIVFLCQNPWPPKDLLLEGKGPFTIFPFEDTSNNNDGFDVVSNTFNNTPIPPSGVVTDGYFNFSTYYCADNGGPGTLDDLPYLRGAVQVTSTIVTSSSSLKRFLFTNTKNADGIGVQVFSNPKHLTVEEWYSSDKASGGQGFTGETQRISVNGYTAITDGNNIYVDALNYSSSTKNIYSNIYLFSINADAKPETRKVFDELIKNLRFNVNITNYGYCGKSVENPNFQTPCKHDLDCAPNEICSASVEKLRRNYNRLRDLKAVQTRLEEYASKNSNTYPELSEGTYLKGQTLSVWPSWSVLGNATGNNFPIDPINELGLAGTCATSTNKFCTQDGQCPVGEKCVLHEPETGWSIENRRFSFACATSSYAYRYISLPSTSTGYVIRANFEKSGIPINNQDNFTKDFIDTSRFIVNSPYGICNQDQEISTLNQGVCGDNQVNSNRGEECDPPGRVRYGLCTLNKIKVDVCNNNCKWTPSSTPEVDCSYLSKCGNKVVEAGEQCDDGNLNGRYNHCTKDCKWPPSDPPGFCGDEKIQQSYEVCDTKSKLAGKDGLCVTGLSWGRPCDKNDDCRQKDAGIEYLAGTCKLVQDTKVRYGKQRNDSCNWDCQSYGPYCGDGIIQAEFGEECEQTQECTIATQKGKRYCTNECKLMDNSPIAWWRFDDAEKTKATKKITYFDSLGGAHRATCTDTECPEFSIGGKLNNAVLFKGNNVLTIAHHDSLMPYTALTVEGWIKPSEATVDWPRILEKGGYKLGGGYGLQFDPTFRQGFVLWGADNNAPALEVRSKDPIPVNEWTHIVGVYERQGNNHSAKLYVNGELNNLNTVVTSSAVMTFSSKDIVIGRASSGGASFKGSIDEIKIYNRVLGAAEIAERFNNSWPCSTSSTVSGGVVEAGTCGDGKVNEGEACDRGVENGKSCNPKYGESCTYCAGDCKNVVDVQSREYCGNGIVEGPEACDTDSDTNTIYAFSSNAGTKATKDTVHQGYELLSCAEEPQATSTFKKGTKQCVNKCLAIQANCTICGEVSEDDKAGVEIKGSILNTLEPTSNNPLIGLPGQDGTIDVTLSNSHSLKRVGIIYWPGTSSSSYYLKTPTQSGYDSASRLARINSDPRCSFGDEPNYKVFFNADDSHSFDFPILAKGASWQYDLILSPVIDQSKRPTDIRIVTTWVNSTPDFYNGFVIPSVGIATTTATTSPGKDYYFKPSNHGIWYHGFGYTPTKTNVRSFTIDQAQMIDDEYAFFVRVPQARLTDPGIFRYKDSARLKVDVYLPESDTSIRHFAKPSMTFYLSGAINSDNPSASYWHVFNISKPDNIQDAIVTVNRIKTKF